MKGRFNFRGGAALGLALLAAGCGGGAHDVRPSNVANLCAIYRENPHWAEAAAEAERKWGVPQEVKMAIIWRESTFDGEARPVKRSMLGVPVGYASSAYGYAQAIDGTWDWYRKDTGADGERDVFVDAIDFVGWYMAKTRDMTGVPTWDAYNQYLAYHEGQTGYQRGSWRQKAWLQRAAAQVAHQAEVYRQQRRACGIAAFNPGSSPAGAPSVAAAARSPSTAGSTG
jgi:hypothetical protein